MNAAPTACTARAPISKPAAEAAAASKLPATNKISPVRKSRLRPHRSAKFPVESRSAARSTA